MGSLPGQERRQRHEHPELGLRQEAVLRRCDQRTVQELHHVLPQALCRRSAGSRDGRADRRAGPEVATGKAMASMRTTTRSAESKNSTISFKLQMYRLCRSGRSSPPEKSEPVAVSCPRSKPAVVPFEQLVRAVDEMFFSKRTPSSGVSVSKASPTRSRMARSCSPTSS